MIFALTYTGTVFGLCAIYGAYCVWTLRAERRNLRRARADEDERYRRHSERMDRIYRDWS